MYNVKVEFKKGFPMYGNFSTSVEAKKFASYYNYKVRKTKLGIKKVTIKKL